MNTEQEKIMEIHARLEETKDVSWSDLALATALEYGRNVRDETLNEAAAAVLAMRHVEQSKKESATPITDKHAFHRITGLKSPNGDVVSVQIARDLECEINTQKELTACAGKNLHDLVALLSGKTPETYNARVKEIADEFLKLPEKHISPCAG